MKRFLLFILIAVYCLTFFNMPVFAQNERVSIIVEYKTDNKAARDGAYKNFNKNINKIKNINKKLDAIEFNNAVAANNAIKSLNHHPDVLIAEIDQHRKLMGVNPNDSSFSLQWGHQYIDATTAWEAASYQQRRVVVAVIDTGVTATHVDLTGKILSGYNAVSGGTDITDIHGHGTFVSGIIAATTNNSIGIAGATGTYDVAVLPIKVLNDATGEILSSSLIAALDYATSLQVDVINMSLGGPNSSITERNAIKRAKDAGIALVASSGNESDSTINYPASYEYVISVASHNSSGVRSSFSNYNAYVDISAPGQSIYSTRASGGYGYGNGTSFSTPYVAGIAAMIKAVAPTKTTVQVTDILTATAVKPIGQTGRSDEYGYGYANASAALKLTLGLDYSATNIRLSYDRVHLGSGLSSLTLDATVNPSYAGNLVWYKSSDNAVSTGGNSYVLESGTASQGSGIATAKIPLNSSNAAACQYSWTNSSAATSIDYSISGVSVSGGTLLGEFHPNKTNYSIHVDDTNILPLITPAFADQNISYLLKNATKLGENTVITVMDSQGGSRIYTFTPTILTENVYSYLYMDGSNTTFAVATYKNEGIDYSLYMICAMYDSSTRKLMRTEIIQVNVLNGAYTYQTSFEVPEGSYVKMMLFEDLENLKPYQDVLVYP